MGAHREPSPAIVQPKQSNQSGQAVEGLNQYLNKAQLEGARLAWAHLENADLSRANLRRANLSGANLAGAQLDFADLREANLMDADLRNTHLDTTLLQGAQYNANTRLPEGFKPLTHDMAPNLYSGNSGC